MNEFDTYAPFADPEDFCTYAKIDTLSPADTQTVLDLLAAASTKVRDFCEWPIWPQQVDDELTVDGTGAYRIILPVKRLQTVAKVVENDVELDPTSYRWSAAGIVRRLGQRWTSYERGLVFTLTYGYSGEKAPTPINQLVCEIVGRKFDSPRNRVREQAGQTSVTFGQTSVGRAGEVHLLPGDKADLYGYRVRP